jgi:hypothetical protein
MDDVRSEVVDVKRMPVREFVETGYLHEVNRRLLHPLGLALEVGRADEPTRVVLITDEAADALRILIDRVRAADPTATDAMSALEERLDGAELLQAGDYLFGGVWDCRDDAEGILFGPDVLDREKARRVTDELNLRGLARVTKLGYIVQPVNAPPIVEVK